MKRLLALVVCASSACSAGPTRDWATAPAIVERDTVSPLYAVSDIHGGYQRVVALLARHGILAGAPASPDAARWGAGAAVLVVSGDLFDNGPDGLGVIDLLRALETSAAAAGGQVIVTLGNHEAEFLGDPNNSKASGMDGFATQLKAQGISVDALARGDEPRGAWLRRRPFAARVGRWFFSHAGDTGGRSVAELSGLVRDTVDRQGFGDKALVGAGSLLGAEDWSVADKTIGDRYARAVGALHLVFGHNPSGLGTKGQIGEAQDGTLFRIDCGLSPYINYSEGVLFQVEIKDAKDVASALRPDGSKLQLWAGSIP